MEVLEPTIIAELPPLDENGTETRLNFKIAKANDARLIVTVQGCEDCVAEVAEKIADVCNQASLERGKKPCGGCPEVAQ